MPKIQIICTKPGMRRNGIEHPASAVYGEDHWTDDELKAFQADPSFIVQQVGDGGGDVQLSSGDIEAAVVARVDVAKATLQADFEAAKVKLQGEFAAMVKEAVDEKIEEAKAEAVKAVQAQLTAANKSVADLTAALEGANAKVAELTAALDEAKAKAGGQKKPT